MRSRLPDHGGLLRAGGRGGQQVTPFELFFDLVFVFAVTQLSHRLLEHLTVVGAVETLLLLLAVWTAWFTTAWVANWFDPDRLPVRLMLAAVMLAAMFVSVAIPEAFGARGPMFAVAYVTIHVGRAAFAFLTLRRSLGGSHPLTMTFERALSWHAAAGVLWLSGGLLDGQARYLLWGLGLTMNLGGPLTGFYVPGLGRSRTAEWSTIQGAHLAERCRLFVIIALGESLLVTGATFGETDTSPATVAALVVAFLGSVALWWVYFHRSAEAASEIITASEDPARLGRTAYSALHQPMIAGIIAVAAADELVVAHPDDAGTAASVALTLGGPALFLAGHAVFKWVVFRATSWAHLAAVAVLAALTPLGFATPALVLSAAAGLTVVGVALWETLASRGQPGDSPGALPESSSQD